MGSNTKVIAGYCTLCRSRCGTLNTVVDGKLTSVAPRPDHPTGRANCAKGRAAPELVHSSRRLKKPLRRTTEKEADDPGWVEISWDDALSEIAQRFGALKAEHGAESVGFALTSPSATPIVDSIEWIERFIALFGSPNVCNGTEVCNWHKDVTHAFTFGTALPTPDYRQADLIVLWGHNPANVWLSEAAEIGEACARGARLAVIDPREISATRNAQHWLPVKPGTDAALALGMSNLLIQTGRYNERFVRDWSNGPLLVREDTGEMLRVRDFTSSDASAGDAMLVFDFATGRAQPFDPNQSPDPDKTDRFALRGRYVVDGIACRPVFERFAEHCSAYPLDRVSAICGVDAGRIAAMAYEIAQAERVAYYLWTGTGQHANATQTDRAIATLFALTGCFDAPGGNVVHPAPPINRISDPALLPAEQLAKALGTGARPLGPASKGMVTSEELYAAILDGEPYRVRALMTFGANLLLSRADSDRGRAALRALEFSVHCDLFETPTGREADLLLPISSPWEREALKVGFEITARAQEQIELRPAMVDPVGESRSDAQIVCDLAMRLGFATQMFDGELDKGWTHVLAPLDLTPDMLRAAPLGICFPLQPTFRKYSVIKENGKVTGFATASHRVEFYSETLHQHGYEPLPGYAAETRARRDVGRYPFTLSCAKSGYFCHSQHRSLTSLRRRAREPSIDLGPEIARRRGVSTGDWVLVETCTGKAQFKARVDPALAADLAVAEFGWWQSNPELGLPGYDPFSDRGSNYNRLIGGDTVDPVSGSSSLKSSFCNVEKLFSENTPGRWVGDRQLTVIRRHDEAGGITVIDLASSDDQPLPPFRAGQHLVVGTDIPGIGFTRRAYSLCNASEDKQVPFYRIGVKRQDSTSSGDLSRYFANHLRAGTQLFAQAPSGIFNIPEAVDFPVVLIAAGVGITPFLGYLETLRQSTGGKTPEVTLIYGSRDRKSEAFTQELAEISACLPSVTMRHFYSQEADKEAFVSKRHLAGRVAASSVDQDLIDRRARFWLCGPKPMINDVVAGLIERGVPKFEIFWEVFQSQSGPPRVESTAGSSYEVTFSKLGRTLQWTPSSGVLLEFASAHGITLPSGCRVGQCENCALRVVSGEVEYEADAPDLDDGVCLTCQATPASDLVLDA